MPSTIHRPLWRSFPERSLARAAKHVRAGGHALVWAEGRASPVAWMLLPCSADGLVPELSHWVILMMERRGYGVIRSPPAEGLATLRIPRRFERFAVSWCERDARFPGSVRAIELDCTLCGACCYGSHAILSAADLARWREDGRADLSSHRYVRKGRGEAVLRLREDDGACVHLNGARCGIYPLRPDPCRAFPVGSEGCLDARWIKFGAVGVDDTA